MLTLCCGHSDGLYVKSLIIVGNVISFSTAQGNVGYLGQRLMGEKRRISLALLSHYLAIHTLHNRRLDMLKREDAFFYLIIAAK